MNYLIVSGLVSPGGNRWQVPLDLIEYPTKRFDFGSAEPRRLNKVSQHRNGMALEHRMEQLSTGVINTLRFADIRPVKIPVSFSLKIQHAFLNQAMQQRLDGSWRPFH